MSATTEATPPPPDVARPGAGDRAGASLPGGNPTSANRPDPYLRGTDETVLLDLRELRAQQAAENGGGAAGAAGAGSDAGSGASSAATGAELETYQGSHRRDAMLYAHGGTAIPLERVREVCHDLRQPVAAILMLASAAELRPDVPDRVRDVLQEIMTQTEDISATVRQFLDDAKQGVDGLGDPVPCNVSGLAAESVERWRATFSGRISLAAGSEPLHVTVDPVLFKRALGNVLSNGTRAAGGAGRVQVTVRRFQTAQGERAVIEVDDSGPGFGNIPSGHGLGLAVVRRTIEAAGGSVEFAEGPLGGALVRLVLPVTPAKPLSADDELARTIHGEVSLSALAEELAGMHARDFDFDDLFDDDDDFEDDFDDEDDEASVTGGHAFATRISALPEPTALAGTPEQAALTGAAPGPQQFSPAPSFRGASEQVAIGGSPAGGPAPGNRLYSGASLPIAETSASAGQSSFDAFRAPSRAAAPAQQTSATSAQALKAPEPRDPAATSSPVPTPQPLHITATGQDDTAVAAIQLPSRANLTHPPRVPAAALRPVASVQLSLLPGGAF